jgi:hypothetical protein
VYPTNKYKIGQTIPKIQPGGCAFEEDSIPRIIGQNKEVMTPNIWGINKKI